MNALLLIGLQNDFLPGGPMAVPNSEAVVSVANQVQTKFKLVVAIQDWHPPNHSSFASNHPGKQPGDVVVLKKHEQILWPVHCLQGSRGADFAPGLVRTRLNKVVKTGTDAEHDSYSGFFDSGHLRATGLGEFLKEKKITTVYILGLATEFAVRSTALDAVMLGFKAFVIEDACRSVVTHPDDVAEIWEELRKAGVGLVLSQHLSGALP